MPEVIYNALKIPKHISKEQHTQGWVKQKELISADEEGLTFLHYKATIQDKVLAEFNTLLRSLPYKHGCTLRHGN